MLPAGERIRLCVGSLTGLQIRSENTSTRTTQRKTPITQKLYVQVVKRRYLILIRYGILTYLYYDHFFQYGENSKRHLPPTPPYATMNNSAPNTRSSDSSCSCKICEIGRMMGPKYQKYEAQQSNKVGTPKIKNITPPAKAIPVCSKCFSMLAKGLPHHCSKVQKQENLANLVKSSSVKSKGKVTNVLKDICMDTGVSHSGGSLNLHT